MDEKAEFNSWWVTEYWTTIIIGVLSGLAANLAWWLFTSGIPKGFLTLSTAISDYYAESVKEAFFGNVADSLVFFIFSAVIIILTSWMGRVGIWMTGFYKQLSRFLVITSFLLFLFSLSFGMTALMGLEEAVDIRSSFAKVQPHIADSTYLSLRSEIASVETHEDLQQVQARIDSLTEE
jgi:hypothetical protein